MSVRTYNLVIKFYCGNFPERVLFILSNHLLTVQACKVISVFVIICDAILYEGWMGGVSDYKKHFRF